MLRHCITLLGDKLPKPETRAEWVQVAMEKVALWQHMRDVPEIETEQFLRELKNEIDKQRMTIAESENAVLRTHEYSEFYGRDTQEAAQWLVERGTEGHGWQTEAQQM